MKIGKLINKITSSMNRTETPASTPKTWSFFVDGSVAGDLALMIREQAVVNRPKGPLMGPISITADIHLKNAGKDLEMGSYAPSGPFIDDWAKVILDELLMAGYFEARAQVARFQISKFFASHRQPPGASILVSQLEP